MDAGRLRTIFTAAPVALSRRERTVVAALSLLVAATRPLAMARSLWDWDEALFVLAVRDYDVAAYHPQPPGFPLFIAAAKLLPFDEFRALQAIVLLSSMLLFPAAFHLARELRAGMFTAAASATILGFLPNVWLYGGTAFSDVPSLVLSLGAAAFLLRGCRSDRALVTGCVMLALAAGIRPQTVLAGTLPAAMAILCRRRAALAGLAAAALLIGMTYGAAAAASGGWDAYRDVLAHHERYIRETDSFLSPIRPSLLRVADDFFYRPFRAPLLNALLALLAAGGLMRRGRCALLALAIFGPFALFAWLYLDFHSVSRFSIGYMPLVALLAAEGLSALGRVRIPAAMMLVALLGIWSWPALRIVRTTDSPPAAAAEWIAANVPAAGTSLLVDPRLGPHAAALLSRYQRRELAPRHRALPGEVVIREEGGRLEFRRETARLEGIVRRRYFVVSVER